MENYHGKKLKQTTKMPCFPFIIRRCLIPFFCTHSGLWQNDQCIKYITVCYNLGEKCAYSPVHLCWKGRSSTWKFTTSVCLIKVYFSQKHKKWHIYCHSLCDRAWISLQVAYSTFQINAIFIAACTFYQHKDDHFLTKCQTCLSLLSHIINDSNGTHTKIITQQ